MAPTWAVPGLLSNIAGTVKNLKLLNSDSMWRVFYNVEGLDFNNIIARVIYSCIKLSFRVIIGKVFKGGN